MVHQAHQAEEDFKEEKVNQEHQAKKVLSVHQEFQVKTAMMETKDLVVHKGHPDHQVSLALQAPMASLVRSDHLEDPVKMLRIAPAHLERMSIRHKEKLAIFR